MEHTTSVVIGTDCIGSCKLNQRKVTTFHRIQRDKHVKNVMWGQPSWIYRLEPKIQFFRGLC
jgi:hypothetical protein